MDRKKLLDTTKSIKDLMVEQYRERGHKLEVVKQTGKTYVEAGFINMVLDELDEARIFAKKCYSLKEWDVFEEEILSQAPKKSDYENVD